MNKIFTLLLITTLSLTICAQDFMTIGEVFDFNINDEFHIKGQAENQSPNADRIQIVDKYYSSNNNTVYYVRHHDSYYTTPLMDPPYLEYHFWTETDTVSYTNLDSSITSYNHWTSFDTAMTYYDTIIGISEDYCDSLINGYQYTLNTFEPNYYSDEFGKGLGMITNYYYNPAEYTMYDIRLFYFKKNDIECGTPDNTTVSINENNIDDSFFISPNPANNILIIENIDNIEIKSISLINLNGQVLKKFESNMTTLDISDVFSGLYILDISTKKGKFRKKIIIE